MSLFADLGIHSVSDILAAGTIVAFVVWGVYGSFISRTTRQQVKDLRDELSDQARRHNEEIMKQREETTTCHEQHKESLQLIGKLQGQVETLKDVPLSQILDNQLKMTEVLDRLVTKELPKLTKAVNGTRK